MTRARKPRTMPDELRPANGKGMGRTHPPIAGPAKAQRSPEPPAVHRRAQAGEWLTLAACRGLDPELFFPGQGEATGPAKAVCAVCPVQAECLELALTNREKFGVWGGKSDRERRAIRRARAQGARAARAAAA